MLKNKIKDNWFNRARLKMVEAVLSNDENSTDEELIIYFMEELTITRAEAEYIVSKRDLYLNNIFLERR